MTALEARLAEMRQRVDAATEGPWIVDDKAWALYVGTPKPWYPQETYDLVYSVGAVDDPMDGWTDEANARDRANATFIAHARTDLPKLLDAVEAVVITLRTACLPKDECDHPGCAVANRALSALTDAMGVEG